MNIQTICARKCVGFESLKEPVLCEFESEWILTIKVGGRDSPY